MKKSSLKNAEGFTLVELMIVIAILATLTILTAQSISQAVKAKMKMQDQIDDVSHLRDAVRLIERDINLAYHYRDIEKELNEIIKKKNAPQTPGQPPNPAQLEQDRLRELNEAARREVPRRDPETHFVGNGESLNFVTLNQGRNVRNSKQADFAEVGYTLKDCRSLRPDGESSKCIWRRNTPLVDLDVTKGGDELVLLENVTEFKLRYIGKGKQDWVSDWRTDGQGDGVTKGKFPKAVEISVTTEKKTKGKSKKYSMQVIVPIHFPNNPENTNAQTTQPNLPTE